MSNNSTQHTPGLGIEDLAVGDVLQVTSGSRQVSVTVSDVSQDYVDLVCNSDWTFQGGSSFSLSRLQFARSSWARAAIAKTTVGAA